MYNIPVIQYKYVIHITKMLWYYVSNMFVLSQTRPEAAKGHQITDYYSASDSSVLLLHINVNLTSLLRKLIENIGNLRYPKKSTSPHSFNIDSR